MSQIPNTESNIGSKTQFGILHLMGFISVVAVALVCSFPDSTAIGQPNPKAPLWWLAFRLSKLLIGVLCLSGAAMVVYHWFAERSFPVEPGRILFLISAFSFLTASFVDWLSRLLTIDVARNENGMTYYFYAFMGLRMFVSFVMIGICVAGMVRDRWWWRVTFGLLAVKSAAAIVSLSVYLWLVIDVIAYSKVFQSVSMAASVLSSIAFLAILVACVIDFAKTEKRSRLHWWGVVCYLLSIFLPWILQLVAIRYIGVQGLFFSNSGS